MKKKLSIPIFSLPDVVFYPTTNITLYLLESPMVKIVRECIKQNKQIGISLSQHYSKKAFYQTVDHCSNVCTIGIPTIVEESVDKRTLKVFIKGQKRVNILGRSKAFPFPEYFVEEFSDVKESLQLTTNKLESLQDLLDHWLYTEVRDQATRDEFLECIETAFHLVDAVAMYLITDPKIKQILLECRSLYERIALLDAILNRKRSNYETKLAFDSIKAFESLENHYQLAIN